MAIFEKITLDENSPKKILIQKVIFLYSTEDFEVSKLTRNRERALLAVKSDFSKRAKMIELNHVGSYIT